MAARKEKNRYSNQIIIGGQNMAISSQKTTNMVARFDPGGKVVRRMEKQIWQPDFV